MAEQHEAVCGDLIHLISQPMRGRGSRWVELEEPPREMLGVESVGEEVRAEAEQRRQQGSHRSVPIAYRLSLLRAPNAVSQPS